MKDEDFEKMADAMISEVSDKAVDRTFDQNLSMSRRHTVILVIVMLVALAGLAALGYGVAGIVGAVVAVGVPVFIGLAVYALTRRNF